MSSSYSKISWFPSILLRQYINFDNILNNDTDFYDSIKTENLQYILFILINQMQSSPSRSDYL